MLFNYWEKILCVSFFMIQLSCSEPEPKKVKEAVEPAAKHSVSSHYALSLGGRQETLHVVDKQAALKAKNTLASENKTGERALATLIGLERWVQEPFSTVKQDLARLAEFEMRKGVDKSVSDLVKFDVMIAAYYSNEWATLFMGLDELHGSTNKQVLALLANFRGILAWKEGKMPEAGVFFNEALGLDPQSSAAILNLAFLDLKYSHASEAEKLLERIPHDGLAQSGLIISSYLLRKDTDANQRCQSFLKRFPNHKPSLFNCAQIAWHGFKDRKRAISLLQKFTQLPVIEKSWEEEAAKFLNSLKTTT